MIEIDAGCLAEAVNGARSPVVSETLTGSTVPGCDDDPSDLI